ncbi:putative holin-like toxin [endosymbiont 'TC1' of Trimyema compressum]
MNIFESLILMISFASLIVAIIKQQKSNCLFVHSSYF